MKRLRTLVGGLPGDLDAVKTFLDENQGTFRRATAEEEKRLGGSYWEPLFVPKKKTP